MTYSISVRPYNDPYTAIAEESTAALAELVIDGAFLGDILPILKYVPDWFPGAKFKRKAAMMRTYLNKAMLNDERDYPEPRDFRPERFLRNGKLDDSVRDPMDIALGFGRR